MVTLQPGTTLGQWRTLRTFPSFDHFTNFLLILISSLTPRILVVVKKLIGCGSYGAVYSVKSNRSGSTYALKLSHGGDVAEKANKHEASILNYLAKHDPGQTKWAVLLNQQLIRHSYVLLSTWRPILRLKESTTMAGTALTFLLFPLMDISLFNFLVDVTGSMPFPKAHIQKIGKQLMEAIDCECL